MADDLLQVALGGAIAAQRQRTEAQLEAQRRQQAAGQPVYYRGGGQVRAQGGDTYRPVGNASAGGTRVGARVQNSQGVVSAQPSVGGRGVAEVAPPPEQIGDGHLTILAPENGTITLIRKNYQPRTIAEVDFGFDSGSGTVAFSHEVGETIAVGDTFTLTLSNLSTDGGDPPEITALGFSVSFKFQ